MNAGKIGAFGENQLVGAENSNQSGSLDLYVRLQIFGPILFQELVVFKSQFLCLDGLSRWEIKAVIVLKNTCTKFLWEESYSSKPLFCRRSCPQVSKSAEELDVCWAVVA